MPRLKHLRQQLCGHALILAVAAGLLGVGIAPLPAAPLADPEVDAYNLRFGSQVFAANYQFTTNLLLVEAAQVLTNMGSDLIKLNLGANYMDAYATPSAATTPVAGVTSLTQLVRDEPSWRAVFDMPFRRYFAWTYTFARTDWADGMSPAERQAEYNEMFELTTYLLTNYNNSGKAFYLGNWEGDGLLGSATGQSAAMTNNPPARAVQGMIDYFNIRQAAIDDAKRAVAHTNVSVHYYIELNNLPDAMWFPTNNNQRVVNAVLPFVTELDFVSFSNYSGAQLGGLGLSNMLDYIEARLSTNKAAIIPGRRVFIGEFSFGASGFIPAIAQEPYHRRLLKRFLDWGCPYALQWQVYGNGIAGDQHWLVGPDGSNAPCFYLYRNYYNQARLLLGEFKQNHGRLPSNEEYQQLLSPWFEQPFRNPVSLTLANGSWRSITAGSALVDGTLTQGVYGEDGAVVRLYWGTTDGVTNPNAWSHVMALGTNQGFGRISFTAQLTNLAPGMTYFYRLHAANSRGAAWAPATAKSTTPASPGLPALLADAAKFTLNWTAVPSATGYRIKRSVGYPGGPYSVVGSTAGTVFDDVGITDGLLHYYVISATNANGEGADSPEIGARARGSAVTVDNFDDSVNVVGRVSRISSRSDLLNGFCLEGGGGTPGTNHIVTFVPDLPAKGAYDVSMRWPNLSRLATNVSVSVHAAVGVQSLRLNQKSTGGTWQSLGQFGFSQETPPRVVLSSAGIAGNASFAADAVRFTPVGVAPWSPVLSWSPGAADAVTLNWSAPAGATGYLVQRAFSAGGPYTTIASVPGTVFTDVTVAPGQAVYYVVMATNQYGASIPSNERAACASIIVDNANASGVTITGTWVPSTSIGSYYGGNYLHDNNNGTNGGKSVRFSPTLTVTGEYAVHLWWTSALNRATNTPVDIVGADGQTSLLLNQQTNGGRWVWLGNYRFNAGSDGAVVVRNDAASGFVVADAVQFVLAATPPASPPQPQAKAGDGFVQLEWEPVPGATSYRLKRAVGSSSSETVAVTSALSFTDLEVQNGTAYCYTVTAMNSVGESDESPAIAVVPNCVSNAPTHLSFQPLAAGQVSLTWNSPPGALSFTVKRAVSPDGPFATLASPVVACFTDSTASTGSIYYYKVCAVTACGVSADSSVIAVSPGTVVDNTDASKVALQGVWTVGGSPGYFGVNYLQDGNTGGGKRATFTPSLLLAGSYDVFLWWVEDANRATNVPVDIRFRHGTNTVTVDQTGNGSAWMHLGRFAFDSGTGGRVVIRNDSANGYVIADAVQWVLRTPAPSIPTGLTARGAINAVMLTWPDSGNAASYLVKRAPAEEGPFVVWAAVSGPIFLDQQVTNGITYYYRVAAVNEWGESADSSTVSATPVALALGISQSKNQVVVDWPAEAAGGVLEATFGVSSPSEWSPLFTIGPQQTNWTVNPSNTASYFRIRLGH